MASAMPQYGADREDERAEAQSKRDPEHGNGMKSERYLLRKHLSRLIQLPAEPRDFGLESVAVVRFDAAESVPM